MVDFMSGLTDRADLIKSRGTQERWIDSCRTSFSDGPFSQPFCAQPLIGEELIDWAETLHVHAVSGPFDISHFAELATKGKTLFSRPMLFGQSLAVVIPRKVVKGFERDVGPGPMVKSDSQRLVEISHTFKQKVFSDSILALICPSAEIRSEVVACPGWQNIDTYLVPYCRESEGLGPKNAFSMINRSSISSICIRRRSIERGRPSKAI